MKYPSKSANQQTQRQTQRKTMKYPSKSRDPQQNNNSISTSTCKPSDPQRKAKPAQIECFVYNFSSLFLAINKGKVFDLFLGEFEKENKNSGMTEDGERIRKSKGRNERVGTRVCKTRVPHGGFNPPQLYQNMELDSFRLELLH